MKEKFIVEDEYEFWEIKVKNFESIIKDYVDRGIKVIISNGQCVGMEGDQELDTSEKTEIAKIAEGYWFALSQLELAREISQNKDFANKEKKNGN